MQGTLQIGGTALATLATDARPLESPVAYLREHPEATYRRVGELFGLSGERVRQLAQRAGLPPRRLPKEPEPEPDYGPAEMVDAWERLTPGQRIEALLEEQGRMALWLGKRLGMSESTILGKITGYRSWQPGEREAVCLLLGVPVIAIWPTPAQDALCGAAADDGDDGSGDSESEPATRPLEMAG